MANEQNLIPFNQLTESERRELAKKAGKKSGEVRRAKKTFRELMEEYGGMPDENDPRLTNDQAVMVSQYKLAKTDKPGSTKAALCSDDQRFNIYNNFLNNTPMISTNLVCISFTQNQGDRNDGNAIIYNGDCSWKKAFALRMICPWSSAVWIKKESNRILFREHLNHSTLYPPICVCDKDGKITGRLA